MGHGERKTSIRRPKERGTGAVMVDDVIAPLSLTSRSSRESSNQETPDFEALSLDLMDLTVFTQQTTKQL